MPGLTPASVNLHTFQAKPYDSTFLDCIQSTGAVPLLLSSSAHNSAKLFLDAYYQKDFTREGVEIWTACGSVEHCVDCLRGFIDAGVDHVAIRPIGADLNQQFGIFLEDLIPALQAVATKAA